MYGTDIYWVNDNTKSDEELTEFLPKKAMGLDHFTKLM